jgi:uncharacterized protein YbjT (DUF2867 family)
MEGLLGGVKTMFLLTGNGPDLATLQVTAIRAAAKSGVEYVVKLSALGASDHSKSPIGRAHYEAEQELIASGISSCWRRSRWSKLPIFSCQKMNAAIRLFPPG